MADEGEQPVTTKEQIALKKIGAAIYAKNTKLFLKRLSKRPQVRLAEGTAATYEIVPGTAIDFDEWREAILAFLHREETVESFNRVLSFCEQNSVYTIQAGSVTVNWPM